MARVLVAPLVGLALMCSVSVAAGQTQPAASVGTGAGPGAHDVTVSFAGGAMVHYLLDQPDPSSVWTLGARFGLTRHIAVEAETARWSYTNVLTSSQIGSGGPPGTPALQRSEYQRGSWSLSANLIARTAGQTVSVWGGGGVGLYRLSSSYRADYEGGTSYANSHGWNHVGVQCVGGVDAVLSRRVLGFAAVRVEIPYLEDFGSTLPGFLGGVRVAF